MERYLLLKQKSFRWGQILYALKKNMYCSFPLLTWPINTATTCFKPENLAQMWTSGMCYQKVLFKKPVVMMKQTY